MKITINTDVLKRYKLSLEQYIVLLVGYYGIDCQKVYDDLVKEGIVEKNLFHDFPPIISDNIKNMVAKIMVESDDRIENCPIKDFEGLAKVLQSLYPGGIKAGKTYSWRGDTDVIAQKLRTLIAKYNFTFTMDEAVDAVAEYVNSFHFPYTYMHTLRNFLLYTKRDDKGAIDMESQFMSIIENNREKDENNN